MEGMLSKSGGSSPVRRTQSSQDLSCALILPVISRVRRRKDLQQIVEFLLAVGGRQRGGGKRQPYREFHHFRSSDLLLADSV